MRGNQNIKNIEYQFEIRCNCGKIEFSNEWME